MSWAASRQTSRTEGIAYCLMGVFQFIRLKDCTFLASPFIKLSEVTITNQGQRIHTKPLHGWLGAKLLTRVIEPLPPRLWI